MRLPNVSQTAYTILNVYASRFASHSIIGASKYFHHTLTCSVSPAFHYTFRNVKAHH